MAPDGPVFVKGALWRGRSAGPEIAQGTPVRVRGVEGLVLRVEADWEGLRLPGGDVRYRVEVSAGVDVRAWTGAGAVGAEGLRGDVDIRTQAGRVDLVNLGGHVRATTQAG